MPRSAWNFEKPTSSLQDGKPIPKQPGQLHMIFMKFIVSLKLQDKVLLARHCVPLPNCTIGDQSQLHLERLLVFLAQWAMLGI